MGYKSLNGLTKAEVLENRRLHGENILTPPEKESLWKRFAQSLTGPFGHLIPGWEDGDMLVFILELAACLSIAISLTEYNGWFGLPVSPEGAKVFFEPVGIIIAIILASGVAFLAEVKAEREFEILNQVNDDEPVTVIREGHATKIPRREVVVGDIIMLSTGEEIPADAELLEATQLSIDESSLTGEPMTHKAVWTDNERENESSCEAFPVNHVFRGTKVMEGHAVARVFAVGDNTENGKVFTASKIDDGKKTPLNEQFNRLGILITTISCIVGVLVLVGRMVLYFSTTTDINWGSFSLYLLQSIMIAVTLVVCAVPEGLPMAVTMALAYSMRKMLKTNNLVRKIHATETMGATTVICTDKTGTLTQNKMQVAEAFFNDNDLTLVHQIMAINSTAMLEDDSVLGNPTEGALLLWLRDKGINYDDLRKNADKVSEEPFSTETKYMSTTLADGTVLYKGAPEIIMAMCSSFNVPKIETEERLKRYQSKAMRTLAFAVSSPKAETGKSDIAFLGIVAISDPVRTDVPEAIQKCIAAGIKIKIVTGDAPETAKEIYRQIFGHEPAKVILGSDIAKAISASSATVPEASASGFYEADIIARARPMDKKLLVEALRARGEVVAVTGDGTNDAPALKSADVGLSMGDGTSVAKEASDITIIDNSFSSICRAVMWGRSLYINIQRFILFQLTVNITACLVVMIGSFMTKEPPLTVTQMLWVNLIMDTFAAIALASLPPSESVMNKPPRNRRDNIIDRAMATDLIGTGTYFTVLLLALLSAVSRLNGTERAVFFSAFIMLQFWNLFMAKYFKTAKSSTAERKTMRTWGLSSFSMIAMIIFLGQWFIVSLAYNFFNIAFLEPDLMCIVIIITLIAILPKAAIRLLTFAKA
ncbi:MAG: calcium-translocating P-type ATPase, PMCA-type [Prevotella sp.]|nr:calcium-translocating P-type ATPase, PMCA-type [Candidatus Prevotella equi]